MTVTTIMTIVIWHRRKQIAIQSLQLNTSTQAFNYWSGILRLFANSFLFLLCSLISFNSLAKEPDNTRLKAALLFNMLKFIEWPKELNTADQINFCALAQGNDSAAHQLSLKSGLNSANKKVVVHIYSDYKAAIEFHNLHGCSLIYFDKIFSSINIDPVIKLNVDRNILMIGNGTRFMVQGGQLSFLDEGDKVTIVTSKLARLNKNLQLSSRFLAATQKWQP